MDNLTRWSPDFFFKVARYDWEVYGNPKAKNLNPHVTRLLVVNIINKMVCKSSTNK